MMRNKSAVFVLPERQRQAFERLRRSIPNELVRQPFDRRTEDIAMRVTNHRMDAVGADDQVAVREDIGRVEPGLERERHADTLALGLQQAQQRQASDRTEAVTVDVDGGIAVNDSLHRPRLEQRRKRRVHCRHAARQEFEGAVREDDAEAECRIARVLLDDAHIDVRAPALNQICAKETGGSRTDNADTHQCSASGLSAIARA